MKSATNSVRSSWVRAAQWRDSVRRVTSSKSKRSRAIFRISVRLSVVGLGAADSGFAAGSMSCVRLITRITAVSTVSRGPIAGAATAPAIMIQAASALPMADPPGRYLSIRHASG